MAVSFVSCDNEVRWEHKPKIRSSAFHGSDVAWLVIEREGALLITFDGGRNWNKVPGDAIGGMFDGVAFADRMHGWAVSNKGRVWRTEDGGLSWRVLSTLTASKGDDWQYNSAVQLEFIDQRNGWLIETLSIWRTEDGGVSWQKIFPPGPGGPTRRGQPTSGSFLDSESSWVSGTNGEVYDTKNGGQSWRIQALLPNGSFREIYFLTAQTGWLVGYVGGGSGTHVYRTDDGGESWSKNEIANIQIESTEFITANDGWAVGREAVFSGDKGSFRGVVLRTADGGQSWNRVDINAEERSFDRAHFVDREHGWLIGRNNIYRTEDGGRTWRTVLNLPPI